MKGELTTHMQNNELGHFRNTLQLDEVQTEERQIERPKSINSLKENLGGNLINKICQ